MKEQTSTAYWHEKLKQLGIIVIIPSYNNGKTLAEVIASVRLYAPEILVVNDGSTDETPEILNQEANLHIITHPVNQVLSARDYKKDVVRNLETGEEEKTGLPNSNVLYYDLADGAWLCVRPSGTEPKVKFYYGVKGVSLEDAEQKSAKLGGQVLSMIEAML